MRALKGLLAGLNAAAAPGTRYALDGELGGYVRISRTTHNRQSSAFLIDLRRGIVMTAGDLEEVMYL